MNDYAALEDTPRTSTRVAVIQEFRLGLDDGGEVRRGYRSVEDVARRLSGKIGEERLREGRRCLAAAYQDEPDSLRSLRLKAGLSQSDLAEAIGATQPHVSRIEAGKCDVQFETARRLCDALNIDMNALDLALQFDSTGDIEA